MNGLLYRWPAAALFGRAVPKTKFYEHATISTAVREKFVSEVQRITWAYKLAEATIHLRGTTDLPEIQVFEVDVKNEDVSDDVLTAIDRAIPFPIMFEINRGAGEQTRTRAVAAHKRFGGTGPRMSAYFSTDWLNGDSPRVPLPPALDLPGLYEAMLAALLPITIRPGEGMLEATSRMDQTRKVEREVSALEKKLRTEPQLNRKVELRRLLRNRSDALTELTAPATQKTEDAPWTN